MHARDEFAHDRSKRVDMSGAARDRARGPPGAAAGGDVGGPDGTDAALGGDSDSAGSDSAGGVRVGAKVYQAARAEVLRQTARLDASLHAVVAMSVEPAAHACAGLEGALLAAVPDALWAAEGALDPDERETLRIFFDRVREWEAACARARRDALAAAGGPAPLFLDVNPWACPSMRIVKLLAGAASAWLQSAAGADENVREAIEKLELATRETEQAVQTCLDCATGPEPSPGDEIGGSEAGF